MLVFLTGQEEIEGLVSALKELPVQKQAMVCPLYAALPSSEQAKAFEMPEDSMRKIVVATNIAETSLTIPGIKVVVDSGRAKVW
jgi:HrpA-like RNA helicase